MVGLIDFEERRMGQGRRKLVAGNWKMNGLHAEGLALAPEPAHRAVAARRPAGEPIACDLLICPPATLFVSLTEALTGSGIFLGGQDCNQDPAGPRTGDLSAGS